VKKPVKKSVVAARSSPSLAVAAVDKGNGLFSPVLAGMLGKEFLYVRRNMGLFYSVVAPLVFVFLFAGRLATRGSAEFVFPAAIGYALLGISPLSYNSFGLEGAGSQFYFFAPVKLREVLLAKNMVSFAMALFEAIAVFLIVSYVAAMPSPQTVASGLLWAAATLVLNTTIGNRRSISAPKKINLARAANKQASPLSAFMGMGILLASAVVGGGVLFGAMYLHLMWLPVPFFAVYAAVAVWFYWRSLGSIDAFAMEHREELFLELCKKD
jgi:ABC-2 type transport system permease protein